MSSDLLREFGSPGVNPWLAGASQSSANHASLDEDDFGDFEDPVNVEDVTNAQSSPLPPNFITHSMSSEENGVQPLSADAECMPPYIQSSITEVEDAPSNDDDWGDFAQQSVIFDADVEVAGQKKEAERILGEQRRLEKRDNVQLHPATTTEAVTATSPVPSASDGRPSLKSLEAPPKPSKDAAKYRVKGKKATELEKPTMDDEPWIDFETVEAAEPGVKLSSVPYLRNLKAVEASSLGPPPSNIPPPSILLPIIAAVFGSLSTELKSIQSDQPLNQPSTVAQIGAFLSNLRAAARILAGRKLRWKRDQFLSQSMKIGPAGKTGGMKLAGVDKAESRREDQEAAEALEVWKQQAGTLRSTIATLNGQLLESTRFKIPDIAENMPIRQGKPSEGVVTAPKCCFLCGIKRDERVAKVDIDVEDSFGEWWVEHWGHVECVTFWENHKDFLRQR